MLALSRKERIAMPHTLVRYGIHVLPRKSALVGVFLAVCCTASASEPSNRLPAVATQTLNNGSPGSTAASVPAVTKETAEDAAPPSWKIDSSVREYTPEHLYQLINGAADRYRAHHVEKAFFMAFIQTKNPRHVIDVYIYDMGAPEHALSIFSAERPEHADPVSLGRAGYRIRSHYFLVIGRYYIRIISSNTADALTRAAGHIAQKLTAHLGSP